MADGTFVLADLGGYSSFLSDVGIEHAKEITSHVFNRLHDVDPDTWKVGNVVGDCLFLYADADVAPEVVADYIRRLYESFRESIEVVVAGSTCECGACNRCGDLTLKFVVHTGVFEMQDVVGRRELIGPDVVVAHRLLKNSVPVREYALMTRRLDEAARCFDCEPSSRADSYDDVGSVDYTFVDLRAVREAFERSREVYLAPAEADVTASVHIDASPADVWHLVMDPASAKAWVPTLIEFETLSGAPDEASSVHTCLHGDIGKLIHYRLAVDEANRRGTDRVFGVPVVERMLCTWYVQPSPAGGSVVTFAYGIEPGTPPADDATRALILDVARQHAEGDTAALKAYCDAAAAGH